MTQCSAVAFFSFNPSVYSCKHRGPHEEKTKREEACVSGKDTWFTAGLIERVGSGGKGDGGGGGRGSIPGERETCGRSWACEKRVRAEGMTVVD